MKGFKDSNGKFRPTGKKNGISYAQFFKKLPNDKKSIALRVLLQPQEKTFTDEEIENISNQIIDIVTNGFEATLRH